MGFCDTRIKYFSLVQFQETLTKIHNKHIVLLLSKNGEERWNLYNCVSDLEKNNLVSKINDTYENPTIYDIEQVLDRISGLKEIDTIIAIGGGSTIDIAKAIRCFYRFSIPVSEDELRNQFSSKQVEECKRE